MSGGKKKKGLRAAAISLAALLVVGGGLYTFLSTRKGKPVEVVPVTQWELGWMPDQMTLYGGIESAGAQSIFADKDVSVTEVLVSEGDAVRVGDPLLRYDATLDSIDLELKQMQMQQLEYDLVDYYKEYKKYARTDYVSTLPSPTPTPGIATGTSYSGARLGGGVFAAIARARDRLLSRAGIGARLHNNWNPPDETLTVDPTLSAGEIVSYLNRASRENKTLYVRMEGADKVSAYQVDVAFPVPDPSVHLVPDSTASISSSTSGSGAGTSGDPYIYYVTSTIVPDTYVMGMSRSFSNARLADAENAGADIHVRLRDGITDAFEIEMIFRRLPPPPATPSPTPTSSIDPSASPSPSVSPGPFDPGGMIIPGGGGSGLTKAEREAMARAAAKKIRDAELEYKQLRLDLQNLQLRGTDGVIRATIDGHVAVCNDPSDTASGQLLLQVKGSEGYFVRCTVGEMELDKVPVGAELKGFSYDTGAECIGRVVEVGTVPLSGRYYYSGRNMSQYEVRIFIEDGTSLVPGYYIEFQLQSDAGEDAPDALYLYQAYVREADGMKYVCVAKDGVLRCITVETGKVMYGYVEIKGSALTREDYIAFPYSKDAKDGAPVTMPDDGVVY